MERKYPLKFQDEPKILKSSNRGTSISTAVSIHQTGKSVLSF
jgi:hypothetical protein